MASPTELVTELPFLPFQQRNTALDTVFYDTGSLSSAEAALLSPLVDREGCIIIVPPAGSDRPIRHYRKALRFMNKEGDAIRAMAVAGVGSSVLGTAALCRNVADAMGCDVAGIVTGYGVSDVALQALGGWFLFGAADRLRLRMDEAVQQATTPLPEAAAPAQPVAADGSESVSIGEAFIPGYQASWDVATLVDILMARPRSLELLVGHSKGSLIVDFVLEQFVRELEGDDHPIYRQLSVVTLGAVADLPPQFARVRQYLGALDWFGGLNSCLDRPHVLVPHAWHHLNRKLPWHLDAVAVLRG